MLWISVFIMLLLVTYVTIHFVKTKPYLAMGWTWYLGTLVPVIGWSRLGSQAMADRYTYLPMVGISICVVWCCCDLLKIYQINIKAAILLSTIVVVMMVAATRTQVTYWQDTITLFSRALEVTHRNFMAHQILGESMAKRGDPRIVEYHFREAIKIKPSFQQAYNFPWPPI
jgi:hypothetical protein